jgi:hypothetical protein
MAILMRGETVIARTPAGVDIAYDASIRAWTADGVLYADDDKSMQVARGKRTVFPPPTFLLLFTGQERVAIRAARAYKGTSETQKGIAAVLDDWFSIIEDPRLVSIDVANPSTRDGLGFLVSAGLLTAERKAEIEAGVEE